jgi:vacuolar protein sorting-associated protein 45
VIQSPEIGQPIKTEELKKLDTMASIITAVHDYLLTILSRVSGMKVLLVDSEVIGIVSMVLSQSQILENEVFLVELIDKAHQQEAGQPANTMKHLKAVAILRPTAANFISLTRELKSPRFSEYNLCMSLFICFQQTSRFHQCCST